MLRQGGKCPLSFTADPLNTYHKATLQPQGLYSYYYYNHIMGLQQEPHILSK